MMKKNFSAYPLNQYTNDGINLVLTPMGSKVNQEVLDAQIFQNSAHFADDCRFGCGDMVSKLSANGISGKDIFSLGVMGIGIWSDDQKRKADIEAAQKAAEITRLQIAKEQIEAKTAAEQTAKAKVSITTVAIVGAVVLGGFAAFYLFAKK